MRRFIINDGAGFVQEVVSAFHPCDDMPPRVLIPAQFNMNGEEISPAVVEDPEPLYFGPREHVVEILDNTESAVAMREFSGIAEIQRQHPTLFELPEV